MSYYKDQMRAFKDLETLLIRMLKDRQDIDISYVIYEMTKVHPVSPKMLRNRLTQFADLNTLEIKDNIIKIK